MPGAIGEAEAREQQRGDHHQTGPALRGADDANDKIDQIRALALLEIIVLGFGDALTRLATST
jgi:hypothetical protein